MTLNKINKKMINGLEEDLGNITTQLAQNELQVNKISSKQMTRFIQKGIAFDARTEATHSAWPYDKLLYDAETDEFIFLYMAGSQHGVYEDRIFMRRKPVDGKWSDASLIADFQTNGIGCTCQAAEIASNGDYLAIISKIVTSTKEVLGAWVYRSADKGQTWIEEKQIIIDGFAIKGATGDVNGLTLLKSGRLIAWGWNASDGKSFAIYSDDNGLTWNFGRIGDGTVINAFEPAFVELKSGTILAVLRNGWNTGRQADKPPLISRSYDNGLTWEKPVNSKSIIDMNDNNGCFLYDEETDLVQFICCTRQTAPDGHTSIYQYACTSEDAENDNFGERYRIGIGPDYLKYGSSDFGYPAVAKSKSGVIMLMYYMGSQTKTNFCYMIGSDTNTTEMQEDISTYFDNFQAGQLKTNYPIITYTKDTVSQNGIVRLSMNDDTLIQYGEFTLPNPTSVNKAWGGMYSSDYIVFYFPEPFWEFPSVNLYAINKTSSKNLMIAPSNVSKTYIEFKIICEQSFLNSTIKLHWQGIGRRKPGS